jgi:lipoprotein-releasing system permease protein
VLFISFKQLFSKKKQTFLILFGISLGTMLFITISGIQLGLREYITKSLLNNTAHILITGRENTIIRDQVNNWFFPNQQVSWITPPFGKRSESKLENYAGWADKLSSDTNVSNFCPRLSVQTIIKKGEIKLSTALTGTLAKRQIRVSDIEDYMTEGKFINLQSGGNKIVLGKSAAEDLGVRVGQYIDVVNSGGEVTPFKIVGLVSFGDERMDKGISFAHLADVQKLNHTPGRVSQIVVALYDLELAEPLAKEWSLFSKDKVEDWKNANPMFMEMIKMQDIVRYFITLSILVVAAFGVYNVLSIMINQKKKEIAILRSIGYGPNRILELIMYQGLFLGGSGGILGLILGFSICLFVESLDLGFEIGGSNHLIISYDPTIYGIAFISAMIASIIASFLPALSASKMTPIDIIRGA